MNFSFMARYFSIANEDLIPRRSAKNVIITLDYSSAESYSHEIQEYYDYNFTGLNIDVTEKKVFQIYHTVNGNVINKTAPVFLSVVYEQAKEDYLILDDSLVQPYQDQHSIPQFYTSAPYSYFIPGILHDISSELYGGPVMILSKKLLDCNAIVVEHLDRDGRKDKTMLIGFQKNQNVLKLLPKYKRILDATRKCFEDHIKHEL